MPAFFDLFFKVLVGSNIGHSKGLQPNWRLFIKLDDLAKISYRKPNSAWNQDSRYKSATFLMRFLWALWPQLLVLVIWSTKNLKGNRTIAENQDIHVFHRHHHRYKLIGKLQKAGFPVFCRCLVFVDVVDWRVSRMNHSPYPKGWGHYLSLSLSHIPVCNSQDLNSPMCIAAEAHREKHQGKCWQKLVLLSTR